MFLCVNFVFGFFWWGLLSRLFDKLVHFATVTWSRFLFFFFLVLTINALNKMFFYFGCVEWNEKYRAWWWRCHYNRSPYAPPPCSTLNMILNAVAYDQFNRLSGGTDSKINDVNYVYLFYCFFFCYVHISFVNKLNKIK